MKFLLAALLLLQDPTPDQLVDQLRSEKPGEREDAVRRLRKQGNAAIPRLKAALEDKDVEVAARCREILEGIASDEAAATFRRIGSSLQKAKSIRIRFKLNSVTHGPRIENQSTHTGILLMKEGNRLHLSGDNVGGKLISRYVVISDGSRMSIVETLRKEPKTLPVPDNLCSHVGFIVNRLGPTPLIGVLWGPGTPEEAAMVYRVFDFKALPPEGKAKRMSYSVIGENDANLKFRATLWYEAESLRPLKRSVQVTFGENLGETTSTEEYEEWTIGADLPDDLFKLPDEGRPVPPAKPLDPKDPGSLLEHAVYNTRSQKSYEMTFKAQLAAPSATFDYKGESVWVFPGILYIHYKATGNNEKRIVRAGEKHVWIYDRIQGEWFTAEESGNDGDGRGVQNPDEVLRILSKHASAARFLPSGSLEVTFTGKDLTRIMKGQGMKGAIDPQASTATVELLVDEKFRIRKFSCDATVVEVAGDKVRYTSEVTLVGYDGAKELVFTDEKKPIALRPEMKEWIETILKSGK